MSTSRRSQRTYRPISIQQRLVSAGLAAGVFVGIGGLIATRMADTTATNAAATSSGSPATAAAVSYTTGTATKQARTAAKKTVAKKTAARPATAATTVVHATTKASKGG